MSHGPPPRSRVTAANSRSVWYAPPTGWVTVLAGLLACGSSPLVRPSQFPSGRCGRMALRSQLRGQPRLRRDDVYRWRLCTDDKAEPARVPSCLPGATRGTSTRTAFRAGLEGSRFRGANGTRWAR